MKFLTSIACSFMLATPAIADISLDFSKLPSEQGWVYQAHGNSASESSVFSLDNGKLVQNSVGVGFSAQGSNRYDLLNALTPGQSYLVEFRAQLIHEDRPGWTAMYHWGMSAGYFDGQGGGFGIGIGQGIVETPWQSYAIDTSVEHTYKILGVSATESTGPSQTLWIDGQLIGTGNAFQYKSCGDLGSYCNSLFIGDGTGGPNANAVYSTFTVNAVPEPETYAMLLAGLGLLGLTHRRNSLCASAKHH